jgi:hypothetical protein
MRRLIQPRHQHQMLILLCEGTFALFYIDFRLPRLGVGVVLFETHHVQPCAALLV